MRRYSLVLTALFSLSAAASVLAQGGQLPTKTITVLPDNGRGVTLEATVARLMSFDANHDGLITRDELPERMQGLVKRADVLTTDGALDAAEVRRLAERPAPQTAVRGFQGGQYGFSDEGFDFDSRLHIDGALDDLRLARDTRQKAGDVADAFRMSLGTDATAKLVAGLSGLLTSEQLADLKTSMDAHSRQVQVVQVDGVTVFGATPQEIAGHQVTTMPLRLSAGIDPAVAIEQYGLAPAQKAQALTVAEEYKMHRSGRLTDSDRVVLLDQLKALLDDQQRDDLRAALERRPLAKRDGLHPTQLVFQSDFIARPTPPQTFGVQDLVLRSTR
jgi:hypothetical protein